jgi:radical SAM-linked protein
VTQAEPITQAAPPAKTLYRIRLVYARGEALRYVSHLDLQTVWERTLRRAGVSLAYSQGFNPHPRLHLASALPLGFFSQHEITDAWLDLPAGSPAPDPRDLAARIQASAPPGLEITHVEIVPLSLPALQTQVQSAEYLAIPLDPQPAGAISQAVAQLLAAGALPRERRGKPGSPGKPYDLRPLVEKLEIQLNPPMVDHPPVDPQAGLALFMRLSAREGATGRPEEVLAALEQDPTAWRVERIKLVLL